MARSHHESGRGVLVACLLILKFSVANAQFKYCCPISKCLLVEKACRLAPLANGTSCVETCLEGRQFTCKPKDLDSLTTYDYSCFAPFIDDAADQPLQKVCGQKYSPGTAPAPYLYISYAECAANCGGLALSEPRDAQAWASPIVQYVLPAVIFSMTIPRRLRLAAPHSWFDFDLSRWAGLWYALRSLVVAGLYVTVDTCVWICIIIATAGPMIVAGLHEAVLDWRVVANVRHVEQEDEDQFRRLYTSDRVQLQSALVCGNLDCDINNPRDVINDVVKLPNGEDQQPQEVESVHAVLSALITSQYSFGQTVGAPVIFYIGSFFYNLVTLSGKKGDVATAHDLAFGMWWMVIVHVAIVAGCLLGNNNSSTIAGIVAQSRRANGDRHNSVQHEPASISWWRVLTPTYDTPFQSVTMWSRGSTKHEWIRNTNAWRENWFKRRIALGTTAWCVIATSTVILISIPSLLAGVVSWNTPHKGLGCRAMTFLLYACCQLQLIIITIIKTVASGTEEHGSVTLVGSMLTGFKRESWRRNPWEALGSLLLFFLGCATALFALSIGVTGTLMQVIGVYSNCKCAIGIPYWANPDNQMCNVASDTLEDRLSSRYWAATGYSAIGFMALICYLGWWYQRYLRMRALRVIETLGKKVIVQRV